MIICFHYEVDKESGKNTFLYYLINIKILNMLHDIEEMYFDIMLTEVVESDFLVIGTM